MVAITESQEVKKGNLWARLTFGQKILFGLAVFIAFFIIYTAGGIQNIFQFVIYVAGLGLALLLAYSLYKAIIGFFAQKTFSPSVTNFQAFVNEAIYNCPDSLVGKRFLLKGDRAFASREYGTIKGVLQLPYYIGELKKDEEGNIEYKRDPKTKEFVRTERGQLVPEFKERVKKEYETLFVISHGRWLWKSFTYPRVPAKQHTALHGADVLVFTNNLVPYGKYRYPIELMEEEQPRIMLQSMHEVLLTTFDHQQDLISTTTDNALDFNVEWIMAQKQATELIQPAQPNR